jgi:hypothetical protein
VKEFTERHVSAQIVNPSVAIIGYVVRSAPRLYKLLKCCACSILPQTHRKTKVMKSQMAR